MALPNGYSNFQTKCFTICAKLYLNIISLQVQQQAEQKQSQQRQRQWQHRQTSRRCQRMRLEVRRRSTAAQGISTMYSQLLCLYIYVFVGVPLSVFVCSTFQVLPPRKRVNCARGWVYAAVKLRFACELNLSAVIFRQVFRITE